MLAAGAGVRYGGPKALADTGSGPWVRSALLVLDQCRPTVVVIGAAAEQVAAVLPAGVQVVRNPHYRQGMGSSLALGLGEFARMDVEVVLVMLVDLPDVTAAVVDRLAAAAWRSAEPAEVLARAAYAGRPGHPVLIGRHHFAPIIAGATGDTGARDYLAAHGAVLVECGDIGGGRDVDVPESRAPLRPSVGLPEHRPSNRSAPPG